MEEFIYSELLFVFSVYFDKHNNPFWVIYDLMWFSYNINSFKKKVEF